MSWFKPKSQPKEDHPMQAEWDRMSPEEKPKSYKGIQFPLGRSGFVPPSGSGGIKPINPPQGGDATIPVKRLLNRAPNPALGTQGPGGQSNRALLKLMKSIEERVDHSEVAPDAFPLHYRSPVVRVDLKLIGEEYR